MSFYEILSGIMRANIAYRLNGEVVRDTVNAKITEFKMNTNAAWRLIVSDEIKTLRDGKPEILKIHKIELPEKTLVKPLSILRHPSAVVVGLMECGTPSSVEEKKCIERVIVYPIKDFEVNSDDLIGVFEVQFTGLFKAKSDKIEREANMVFEKGDVMSRKRISAPSFEYKMSPCAYWIPLISDERKIVQKSKAVRIKIKDVNLPINTIVKPLCGLNHALGTVIDVIGEVKLVEEPRKLTEAIFIPIRDGIIEKNDILGALNVYYVATKEKVIQFQEEEFRRANITYTENGEIKRKKITTNAVGYVRTFSGYWIPIVSEEDKDVRAGEVTVIKVRDILIPEYTVVSPIHTPTHALGCVLDIKTNMPKKIEERKSVSEVIFLPVFDGRIKKNDLLGSLSVHEVYFTWDLLLFPPEPPEKRLEELKRRTFVFTE